ncbi:hypothetical protein QYM36_007021 [Artemia franciscana]|uniref:Uncharacterized protein n=1 Tax=Artemia franciscana TaxID=6661 RepID=A0AA88I216_ARTSF|nr:hypothetical protein QYM36_007021 [Artemia franciscana]
MFDTKELKATGQMALSLSHSYLVRSRNSFKAAVTDEEYSSIGEMTVHFKERNGLTQCIAYEPTKWGVQIWLQPEVSVHVDGFEPYQGSCTNHNHSTYGLEGDIVVKLTRGLEYIKPNHALQIFFYFRFFVGSARKVENV